MKELEQTRLHVLNTVLEHQLPVAQAAYLLGVGERHTWRILAAYRKEGAAALAHGNRRRRPHNAVSDDGVAEVVQLATTSYAGANHTHLSELLRDREGIDLSRQTVHRILTRGHPQPAQTPSAQTSSAKAADAPGGNTGAGQRQPASVVG